MPAWSELADALADDAESLAVLHDRELTAATLQALRGVGFPDGLGLLPASDGARDAWTFMRNAMAALPAAPDAADLDELAAEYAAIYLTGAYGASPCESVWLDDDHLICQGPMFDLRKLYAARGLGAADWRHRPDDHLVIQLLFVAHCLRNARGDSDLAELAQMLDTHLLLWLPDFAARVATRAALPFHAALAALTAAWTNTLRDVLAKRLGMPRPTREQLAARLAERRAVSEPSPAAFMPGCGPAV